MDIFKKKTTDERIERTERLIQRLQIAPEMHVRDLGGKLRKLVKNPEESVIKPVYLYADCIEMMMENSAEFQPWEYADALSYGEQIYKEIFLFDEETPEFEQMQMVFLELFDEKSVIKAHIFDATFFHLFVDKTNYIKWAKGVGANKRIESVKGCYIPYAIYARSCFADEDRFTAHMISFCLRLLDSANAKQVYETELEKLEHMCGIYDVNEARLLNMEQRLDSAELLYTQSMDLLKRSEDRIASVDGLTKSTFDKLKQFSDNQVESVKVQLSEFDQDMSQKMEDYTESQKKVILFEKQEFIKQTFAEAKGQLNEMQHLAQMVVNAAKLDLMRVNQESESVLSKLDQYMKENSQLSQMLSDKEQQTKLMEKLDKLMILNDQNVEQMAKAMQARNEAAISLNVHAKQQTVSDVANASKIELNVSENTEEIPKTNFFLDETISFRERYEMIMEEKKKRMEQGEHFHKMFDDVLIAVMENANPYLIGPTGCGKTFLVGQIASLLQMDFIDIGYINEEYDILGFQTANGGYSRPNFYRCYKYGKIAFCDELDNGNSRATVKLNSFLSNTKDSSYNFPNGENVKRHGSFRMIAAGNTAGNGANSNYNTREKIEESVQQRLMPIFVGYDNAVEKEILKDYEDWYLFVELFRRATDDWGKGNYGDAPGIITTRDVARIKNYLDHGSFDAQRIVEYEFVQTKDDSYLAYLSSYMTKHIEENSPAKHLLAIFNKKVEKIRNL